MTTRPTDLKGFLEQLPNEPIEFPRLIDEAINFLEILGYEEDVIIHQPSYPVSDNNLLSDPFVLSNQARLTADLAVAHHIEDDPYLILNVRVAESAYHAQGNRGELARISENYTRDYLNVSGASYSVELTNYSITVDDGSGKNGDFNLISNLDKDDVREIFEEIGSPKLPSTAQTSFKEFKSKTLPERIGEGQISTEHEEIILSEYGKLLSSVYEAETNTEKKETLENLSAFLFNSLQDTTARHPDVKGETQQIDLVVENFVPNTGQSLFGQFGRYILVECKNWSKPVGAKQVRDFKSKLNSSHSDFGIIFAKNGVSGGESGKYAYREIHDIFQREEIVIVVINGSDLRQIGEQGESFYEILDEKAFQVQFRQSDI
jgi:hypothetical protein